jgi:4-amino-4-deoxy-L-arabinose transferase-like glycosyltransferase
MRTRAALSAVVGTAALVLLAYQRPVAYRVEPADGTARDSVEEFGAAGSTRGIRWRWIGPASRLVFRDAGQIVPRARLRVKLGLPPEAGPRPRQVVLALGGVRLADLQVTPGFAVHELPLDAGLGGAGDWVLAIGAESIAAAAGAPRSAVLAWAEVASETPVFPPWRSLALALAGAIALSSILDARLSARSATALALAAAVLVALGLAFARVRTVGLLPPIVAALALCAAVDRARRSHTAAGLRAWLASPAAAWTFGVAAPAVALGGLVIVALGGRPAVGVTLFLVALGVWLWRFLALPSSAADGGLRGEGILVLAAAALALAFRLYRLEEVPFAIFRDEARHGLLALRLLADGRFSPLFLGPPINQPIPYFVAVTASFAAFGPSLFSLRLVSALAGAFAVPLLWLLVREVVGPRVGVLAALGLAVSSWHVSISRFAVNYVEPSLFSLPAYLLLWRGLRRDRPVETVLGGLLVALGQYAAHTAKALLVVSVGLVVDEAICRLRARDRAGLRRVLRSAAAAAAAVLLVLLPLLQYLRENPRAYLARAQQVSIWGQAEAQGESRAALLVRNLSTYALAFDVSGDRNGRHHLPGAPFLDPLSGLGFLAGLGVALARPDSRAHRFLLLWLIAGLLPGILTVDAPSALRTVEAAPAVYALAALGAVHLWTAGSRGPMTAWRLAAAAAVSMCIAWNAWTYFVRMYDSPAVWRRFAPIATHLGKRLRALRLEGALPPRITLLVPKAFLDDPDNRFVLEFYWPDGLTFRTSDGELASREPPEALLVPNLRDLWALVAAVEPRYARDAAAAVTAQRDWEARALALGSWPVLVGPPFPASDRPTYWLYLRR